MNSTLDFAALLNELNPDDLDRATPEELHELVQLLPRLEQAEQRIDLESSLCAFVRAAWYHIESAEYVDNWHIAAICEHLQAVTSGQILRLLINIPPGCSKSLLTCVFWPCWEWARTPHIRWFFASYDQRLSTRDSVKCRALINSEWYQNIWGDRYQLTHDQNQKTYFETDQKGYRLATSVGGHGTGEHPDRIVVDDPHNVKEAESELERQSVLEWWDLTMSTRGVARTARRVIIMQRLHHEDLAGHVLAKGDWVHICLPMRYETARMVMTPLGWNDPRCEEGRLLTPEQFSEIQVKELERNLGAYGIAGQLQQNPTPREGGMFKEIWFNQRVKAAPYEARRIRFWDRAATEGAGCYTAGVLMAHAEDGNWYVEDVVRGQWEPDQRNEQMKAAALRDRQRYGPHHEPIIWVEAEGGSSGRDAWKGVARALAGFPVREDKVTGKKEVRAEPWACQLAAKNVYLVDNGESQGTGRADWDIGAYVLEHCQFPLGKYLDQVDSSSGAFNRLVGVRRTNMLQTFQLGKSNKTLLRIVLCDQEQLISTVIEQRCLLISITDPQAKEVRCPRDSFQSVRMEAGSNGTPADQPPLAEPGREVMSTAPEHAATVRREPLCVTANGKEVMHRLPKLLEQITLAFADINPEEYQHAWNDPVEPYGLPAAELILKPEQGKKLWAFVTKKREPAPEVIVIQDQGDRRAVSMAYALCDVLNLPRSQVIYQIGNEDWHARPEDKAPNIHVFNQLKSARGLVV